jgi:hypothetical protein
LLCGGTGQIQNLLPLLLGLSNNLFPISVSLVAHILGLVQLLLGLLLHLGHNPFSISVGLSPDSLGLLQLLLGLSLYLRLQSLCIGLCFSPKGLGFLQFRFGLSLLLLGIGFQLFGFFQGLLAVLDELLAYLFSGVQNFISNLLAGALGLVPAGLGLRASWSSREESVADDRPLLACLGVFSCEVFKEEDRSSAALCSRLRLTSANVLPPSAPLSMLKAHNKNRLYYRLNSSASTGLEY